MDIFGTIPDDDATILPVKSNRLLYISSLALASAIKINTLSSSKDIPEQGTAEI